MSGDSFNHNVDRKVKTEAALVKRVANLFMIEGRPGAFERSLRNLARSRIGAEHSHDRVQPFEIVALRPQLRQPLDHIEKARLPPIAYPLQIVWRIKSGSRRFFFEVSSYQGKKT